jgi:hypothetical protein
MTTESVTPLVFEGESAGIRVRVAWDPTDPETVHVFTLAPGGRSRWSRPLELHATHEGDRSP